MEKLMDWYCHALEMLIAAALAIMVLLVFGNVVLRYGFNSGITISEELSRWLFIWSTFLGAIVALRERGHLGIDMVVSRLPSWGKRACLVTSQLLMLFITWLLFSGSWTQTKINMDTAAPVTGLSMAWVFAVGIVFAVLCAIVLLSDLLRLILGKVSDDEIVMIQESEEAVQLKRVLDDAAAQALPAKASEAP